MKLELLLKREDFYKILSETLSIYLTKHQEWSGLINFSSNKKKEGINLYVNKRLNLIFTNNCSPAELRGLTYEYSYHKKILKRTLQKIYIRLSLSRSLRSFFSHGYINISPIIDLEKFCILPGNHSIRLIDLNQPSSLVLAKAGEKLDYLKRIVTVRTKYKEIPGPKIFDWDLDTGWYTEEFIQGRPINRAENNESSRNALAVAGKFIKHFCEDTLISTPFDEWLYAVSKKFEDSLEIFTKHYESTSTKDIKEVFNRILSKLDDQFNESSVIDTALTHGDFQDANILIPSNNYDPVYLIDWEYSYRRYIHYDLLVFMLKTRFPDGLSDRLISFMQEKEFGESSLITGFEDSSLYNNLKSYIYVFLLEDLLFRLEDSLMVGAKETPEAIFDFIEELKIFFKNQGT